MRTQGFHTRLMLAIAGALGVVLALSRPWYAMAPERPTRTRLSGLGDINGPLNDLCHGMQRWVTGAGGATGWDALDQWAHRARRAGGHRRSSARWPASSPPLQSLGRDLLRYGALAVFAITLWKLLDPPGANAAVELRLGALIGRRLRADARWSLGAGRRRRAAAPAQPHAAPGAALRRVRGR